MAGLVVFVEGKKIKKIEGIPVEEEEVGVDVEKESRMVGPPNGRNAMAADNSKGKKEQDDVDRKVVSDRGGDGEHSIGTRTTTEKTRGKHWYQRH